MQGYQIWSLAFAAILLSVSACDDSVGPRRVLHVGVTVNELQESPVLRVQVRGDGVVVGIRYATETGCAEPAQATLTVDQDLVVISPFYYALIGGDGCPDIWRTFEEDVFVPASMIGDRGIVVRGIKAGPRIERTPAETAVDLEA